MKTIRKYCSTTLAILFAAFILSASAHQVKATPYACYINNPPHTLRSPGDVRIVSSPSDCVAGETWISWDIFPVGSAPISINFDGTNIWVLNSNCWQCPGSVTKLRASDGANLGTFPAGQTPEKSLIVGEHIWITNRPANTLTKLRLSDGSHVATYNVRRGPADLAFDGTNIWVSYYLDSSVSRIRPSDAVELSNTPGVSSALGILFDGSNVWVSNNLNEGKITKISGSTGAILGVFSTNGRFPGWGVGFDGTNIWLNNSGTQTIAKFSDNGTIVSQFSSGFGSDDFAFDGTHMWVPNEDVVLKYRASDGALLGSFPNSNLGGGAVFDGTYVWATNRRTNTVTRYRDGALVVACPPQLPGLVSSWAMDGNVLDFVGNNNPSSTNSVNFETGKINQGVKLGSNGFIEIPDSSSLRNQQFTLSAWVRPDGVGNNFDIPGSVIINKSLAFPRGRFEVSVSAFWSPVDRRFRLSIGDVASQTVVSANVFPTGHFYHVVATYDGTSLKLFVNGQLEGQRTLVRTIEYDSIPWTIGSTPLQARNEGYPRRFDGVIDHVQIYNRPLSDCEIENLYNFPNGSVCSQCDSTAPTTTVVASPAANFAGWNNSDVSVSLSAVDSPDGSGVSQITYSASGAQTISSTTVNGANASLTITVEGETTVTYFARDNAGNTETPQTLTIRIDKTAPVISNLPSNQSVVATGANGAAVSWTAPTVADNLDPSVSVSCSPVSGSVFAHGLTTVSCTSTDRADNTTSRSFTVEVLNARPTVNAGGPYQVNEGGTVSLAGSGADVEGTTLTYEWDLNDDGSFETVGQNPNFSAASLDGPTSRVVKLRVTDAAGLSAVSTATVNVLNIAPTLHSVTGPVAPQAVNTTVNVLLSYTDPAGSLDQYTPTINWGDGAVNNSTSHVYTAAGVYRVRASVADDDGGISNEAVYEYVVIYDPAGGFVTGGGWIMSPTGAYAPNPGLTGRANFGFVSKYRPGANVPTGNTEFQFHAGSFNFKSDTYEWLVVAGSKAQFKGSGSVNGVAGYRFMLTDRDGQANGGGGVDKFRIKIWNDGGVIYDNARGEADEAEPQTIGGGSIVIHF